MSDVPQLRLRVSEELEQGRCSVLVLDMDDQVLGDLASSVLAGGVKWEMSGGLGLDKSKIVRELSRYFEGLSRGSYTHDAIVERLIDAYEERRGRSGGPNRGLGIVTIQLACERAQIDTIEVSGTNAPKRPKP